MVLGVDATRAVGLRTGVGRILEYLLCSWMQQDIPFEEVRVFTPAPLHDFPSHSQFTFTTLPSKSGGFVWQTVKLRPQAAKVNVLYSPYTLPLGLRAPSVVHNLGIYEGAEAIPGARAKAHSWHFRYSARRADEVVAVSSVTRDELARHFRIPESKISIVWPGIDRRFHPSTESERTEVDATVAELLGKPGPFFLFVGKFSRRRNVPALLEAFAALAARNDTITLVLVGPNAGALDLDGSLRVLGIGDRVRYLETVARDQLPHLYAAARAFVMPTTSEGFSLTTMEAMAVGCPVLVLRGASLGVLEYLRERGAGTDAVLEAADASAPSLERALDRLARDDELCADLRAKALRASSRFPTWDDNAREMMAILSRTATRRGV